MPPKIPDAREILLAGGKRALFRNGYGQYGKFSIRELAAECGMAVGTFYRYFRNKDDLARQVLETEWDEVLASLERIAVQDAPFHEKMQKMYANICEFIRNYHYCLKLFKPTKVNTESRQRSLQKFYDRIRVFLQIAEERGEVHMQVGPDSAAFFLGQLFLVTAENPSMTFEALWNFMRLDQMQ